MRGSALSITRRPSSPPAQEATIGSSASRPRADEDEDEDDDDEDEEEEDEEEECEPVAGVPSPPSPRGSVAAATSSSGVGTYGGLKRITSKRPPEQLPASLPLLLPRDDDGQIPPPTPRTGVSRSPRTQSTRPRHPASFACAVRKVSAHARGLMSKATQRGGGDEEDEEEGEEEDVAREERVVRRCAVATPLPGLRGSSVEREVDVVRGKGAFVVSARRRDGGPSKGGRGGHPSLPSSPTHPISPTRTGGPADRSRSLLAVMASQSRMVSSPGS
jgi:hypothetical protein